MLWLHLLQLWEVSLLHEGPRKGVEVELVPDLTDYFSQKSSQGSQVVLFPCQELLEHTT